MTTCIEHVRTVRVVDDAYEAVWVGGEIFFFQKFVLFTCIARRVLWDDTTI